MRKPVVIAIHYQNEVLHPQGGIRVGVAADSPERAGLIEAAGRLLTGARSLGVPVISVRIAFRPDYADVIANCRQFSDIVSSGVMIEGSWGAGFHEALGPLEGEFIVTHTRNNPFYGSALEQVLTKLGATQLIFAGIATNYAVEHGVRHASDTGWDVVVASDACSAGDRTLHDASLRSLSRLAAILTVEEILSGLERC